MIVSRGEIPICSAPDLSSLNTEVAIRSAIAAPAMAPAPIPTGPPMVPPIVPPTTDPVTSDAARFKRLALATLAALASWRSAALLSKLSTLS